MQFGSEGSENLRWTTGDRNVHLLAADIHKGCQRIQHRQTYRTHHPVPFLVAMPEAQQRSGKDKSFQRENPLGPRQNVQKSVAGTILPFGH